MCHNNCARRFKLTPISVSKFGVDTTKNPWYGIDLKKLVSPIPIMTVLARDLQSILNIFNSGMSDWRVECIICKLNCVQYLLYDRTTSFSNLIVLTI